MKHLAPDQLLALAERPTAGPPDAHVAVCERCRSAVERLRATLAEVAGVEVPEPSPLFWEQLSRRVGGAVREEPPAPPGRFRVSWRLLAPIGALAIVVVAASVWVWRPGPVREAAGPAPFTAAEDAQAGPGVGEDEAWLVVASLAEGVGEETVRATGIAPEPGSVEEAARELSPGERAELIRLLRAETVDAPGTEG